MPEPASSAPAQRLAAVLFAVLALATVGTLALTQELRSRPDVVNSVRVRAFCDRPGGVVGFRLTKADSSLGLEVVGRRGDVVAEPIDDEPTAAGEVETEWDGRDAAGERAAPGRYRIRFRLGEHDRRAFMPGTIRIPPVPPAEAPDPRRCEP